MSAQNRSDEIRYGARMASPVLLCTDGSELSIAALRAGVELLGADTTYAVVTVMNEPDPMWVTGTGMAGSVMTPDEFEAEQGAAKAESSEILAATQKALGLEGAETHVLRGSAGEAISELAESLSARAIVVGTRGRGGLKRAVLGSVSDHLVRNAPCPVVVTGGPGLDDDD
jgi:nucleotide-binding universal stress UspA family protein